jgi:protoporphyrinogen IX oxidase
LVWLKFIHIAAISLWSAGLIGLPGLYVRRGQMAGGPALHRLQAQVRFLYTSVVSPAAFVGIATGTALIFLRETWAPWFAAKLLFVGVLATIHLLTGLVIIRLFEEGRTYPVWRSVAATILPVATATAILVLVLAKPELPAVLPDVLHEPGGLCRLLGDLTPCPRS